MDELIEELDRLLGDYNWSDYEVCRHVQQMYLYASDNDILDEFWDKVNPRLSIDELDTLHAVEVQFSEGRTLHLNVIPEGAAKCIYTGTSTEQSSRWYHKDLTPIHYQCRSCLGNFTGELRRVFSCTHYRGDITWSRVCICDNCSHSITVERVSPRQLSDLGISSSGFALEPSTGLMLIETLPFESLENAIRARHEYINRQSVPSYNSLSIEYLTVPNVLTVWQGRSAPSPRVHTYSTSPFETYGTAFVGGTNECKPKNNRFYGIELEVEYGNKSLEVAKQVINNLIHPFGIMTSDSSLRDGFEIKSLPATLKGHREIWTRFFEGKPNKVVSSWKSGRCGMHVHVSAASITPMTLGKLNMFINNSLNWDFISLIAGRNIASNNFCLPNPDVAHMSSAYLSKNVSNRYKHRYKRHYTGKALDMVMGHHNAFVSIESSNKPTYEFRIFRGNLAPAGFFKNLEFVDALITWAEETSTLHINKQNFIDWLIIPANASHYRFLLAYLQEKKVYEKVRGLTVYHDEEKELRVS